MTPESKPTDRRGLYVLVSLLVLLPCHWQPRIQAGDLSSHIYNAWLAHLIETGRAEGLVLVRQTTNVLFDLILSGLFRLVGTEAAQRIAVSLTVLIFVWGAFAFASVVSHRRPWHLMPCVAMLAYGWVFHMGFFNFYLSMGLCLWVLAVLWKPTRVRVGVAAILLAAAFTAHALPVAWSVGLLTYLWVARRTAPRRRALLTAGCLLAVLGCNFAVSSLFVSRWSPGQLSTSTGADQLWVFGVKYYAVLMGMLLFWGLLFVKLLHQRGVRRTVLGIPFQLCVISAAIVVALPTTILLPGYRHSLVYIAERMSLGVGVCVCALLGAAYPSRAHLVAMSAIAAVFFAFLYVDERALNRFEDQMQGVVAQLPAGQRVVSVVDDPSSRSNAVTHMIDRVCIGHCYSYANYEACTGQFRVRIAAPNPYVVATYGDSWKMQRGTYVWRESDLPAYKIDLDRSSGSPFVTPVKAGSSCGTTSTHILPRWTMRYSGAHYATGWNRLPGRG